MSWPQAPALHFSTQHTKLVALAEARLTSSRPRSLRAASAMSRSSMLSVRARRRGTEEDEEDGGPAPEEEPVAAEASEAVVAAPAEPTNTVEAVSEPPLWEDDGEGEENGMCVPCLAATGCGVRLGCGRPCLLGESRTRCDLAGELAGSDRSRGAAAAVTPERSDDGEKRTSRRAPLRALPPPLLLPALSLLPPPSSRNAARPSLSGGVRWTSCVAKRLSLKSEGGMGDPCWLLVAELRRLGDQKSERRRRETVVDEAPDDLQMGIEEGEQCEQVWETVVAEAAEDPHPCIAERQQ